MENTNENKPIEGQNSSNDAKSGDVFLEPSQAASIQSTPSSESAAGADAVQAQINLEPGAAVSQHQQQTENTATSEINLTTKQQPAESAVEKTAESSIAESEAANFESKLAEVKRETLGEAPKVSSKRLIIGAAVLVIILGLAWQWNNSRDKQSTAGGDEENVKITVNGNQEEGTVNILGQENKDEEISVVGDDNPAAAASGPTVAVVVYYSNTQKDPGMIDCGRVYPLERLAERKYDSEVINTVRGLLTALTEAEKAAGWVSSIPAGTFLSSVKINNGEAVVNLTGGVKTIAGACAVTAAKAQLEKTLLQFPYISQVTLCVEGNCQPEEIFQP